jgi:hypothetical protein
MQSLDTEPISQVLAAPRRNHPLSLGRSLWGFGGVHGGLALALVAVAMRERSSRRALRRISGQFRRPLREPFTIEAVDERAGRAATWLTCHAITKGEVALVADAVFSEPADAHDFVAPSPSAPVAAPPRDCPTFTIPPTFVPFARRTEIRPVGDARPFSGASEPALLAWLRLVDDDAPIDEVRLIVLMDSLAPSYAAVLATPVPIPTVTFSVTPGSGLASSRSPWLLLRALSVAGRDGWITERLDAWAPDGAHLGSGEQLRVVTREMKS